MLQLPLQTISSHYPIPAREEYTWICMRAARTGWCKIFNTPAIHFSIMMTTCQKSAALTVRFACSISRKDSLWRAHVERCSTESVFQPTDLFGGFPDWRTWMSAAQQMRNPLPPVPVEHMPARQDFVEEIRTQAKAVSGVQGLVIHQYFCLLALGSPHHCLFHIWLRLQEILSVAQTCN